MRQLTVYLLLIGSGFIFQNCSKMNFNGQSNSDASTQNQQTVSNSNNSGNVGGDSSGAIPEVCDQNGITQSVLITENTMNGVGGNFIDYEISLSDCSGGGIILKNDPVLFDINAFLPVGASKLNYTVNDGVQIFSGQLTLVSGKDLFGNTGTNYSYWSTDILAFSGNTKKITFRVYLMGQKYFPYSPQYQGVTELTQDFMLDTYLKFGKALPVTKQVLFAKPQ